MKKTFLLYVCLILGCMGCAEKKPELLVDEIYISKHVVAPPLKSTIRFYAPGTKPSKKDTTETMYDFCSKGIGISHSLYKPRVIIKLNKWGKLQAFYKNCGEMREGFFVINLSDSMISYFNDKLYKMKYKDYKKSVYSRGDGAYCGHEYFVYIRNGENIKTDLYLDAKNIPGYFLTMIDSMYNYLSKVTLMKSPTSYFRKDTLIVMETEAYWDSTDKHWPY
jgi:hypothetical protein